MELKDIVLSTLAEIDSDKPEMPDNLVSNEHEEYLNKIDKKLQNNHVDTKEEIFLNNLRERVLVLFEGFKSPNNKNIEAKVDLTLNFLEYLLATIDDRLKENAN